MEQQQLGVPRSSKSLATRRASGVGQLPSLGFSDPGLFGNAARRASGVGQPPTLASPVGVPVWSEADNENANKCRPGAAEARVCPTPVG